MRINARNVWGAENSTLDPQRKDLWIADFSQVLKGLDVSMDNFHFFARSITLPDLAIQTDTFKRGSANFLAPGWDVARGSIKFVFRYDSPSVLTYSQIFDVFSRWESRVRAGREGYSTDADLFIDDFSDFKIPFRWDVDIHFLRGLNQQDMARLVDQLENPMPGNLNTLDIASSYRLVNCWLAGRTITELDNQENGPVEIQALLVSEDVVMLNS